MYGLPQHSTPQRFAFAAIHCLWLALAWWLLFGGGLATAGHWFGAAWNPGNPVRRICLAAGFSVYYIRVLFTVFVFQKQGVSWGGAFGVTSWILCIYLLLAIAGGTSIRPFHVAGGLGALLFVFGSWMNSWSEYARHVWKQRASHRGQLYTEGLFRYSRHPNYLGDLLSFSGLCLISGAWVTAVIPLIMLAGFVFFNIPLLDSHLHDHYGAAFDAYARRTSKLIPFLY